LGSQVLFHQQLTLSTLFVNGHECFLECSPHVVYFSTWVTEFFKQFRPNSQNCMLVHKGLVNPNTLCFTSVVLHVLISTPEIYNFLMELDTCLAEAVVSNDG
jgi:hypothetical protein